MLIAAGSVTAAPHFLGHKNTSETPDTYSRCSNDEDRMRTAIGAGFERDLARGQEVIDVDPGEPRHDRVLAAEVERFHGFRRCS